MEGLLSNSVALAAVIVVAILLLGVLWKVLQGTLKLAATLACVALISLAVLRLAELGYLGF